RVTSDRYDVSRWARPDASASPKNAASPRTPRRQPSRSNRRAVASDHSDPPSSPNTNPASAPNRSICAAKLAPSPAASASNAATLRARSLVRTAWRPSGRTTPVGRSLSANAQHPVWKLGPERGDRRRGNEQHNRRRHHVVDEAGRGRCFGADAAADTGVAFEHEDAAAFAAEHRGANQRIDAAADDDVVGRAHG